ncbi:AroM family protein [Ammoniphilus sp. CFH 90114]|uniref:AroM family protein n=1 Tax=Ammoniphilus sp. CFH 90114 TaxID=2493665 RepID=UPI00100E1386|nr:AroM family protein [Ammoniphilus sp. CFH 90114]RXT07105.1 hypothetical protein EIZ39_13210 [Ammoniphilus sp. CFH 90114]
MIGFITIGQTPREDLIEPYEKLLAGHELKMVGALDGIDVKDIPPCEGHYPLITKLRNGEFIQVEKDFLETRIQGVIEELEKDDVSLIVLLCAGDFNQASARVPVIQPNQVVPQMIRWYEPGRNLGLMIPIANQEQAAREKWKAHGYDVFTRSVPMNTNRMDEELLDWLDQHKEKFATLLFDCTGYPLSLVQEVREVTSSTVFSTDELLVDAIQAYLRAIT